MPLKLDTLTLDGKTVSGQPTLRCYYSHTQFNLGWLDSGPRGAPSEAYRNRCDPYPGRHRPSDGRAGLIEACCCRVAPAELIEAAWIEDEWTTVVLFDPDMHFDG